ncbi:hypothetical protein BKA62DRAFT_759584 [Auriculariales sp. MPI-PUGE-AT-0066]|nr:hypothetical protein BKA62DRAFT_759584 [Auriculariales sp. MPI-PUGE-AT-0066]
MDAPETIPIASCPAPRSPLSWRALRQETKSVRDLRAPRRRLRRAGAVHSEIEEVLGVLRDLEERRKVHRARARELDRMLDEQQLAVVLERAHLHPIRNTPVEVLGHIFETAVRDANDISAVTFGTSEYCNHSSENVMAYSSFGRMHKFVRLVVSRSGQIPLHLDVFLGDIWSPQSQDLTHTLGLVAQRIVTFKLLVQLLKWFEPVLQLFQHEFPALRCFSAVVSRRQESPIFHLRAPNLRSLELSAAAALPSGFQLFSSLKKLEIDYGDFMLENDPMRRLLAAAPMIEELYVFKPWVANRNMKPVDIVHSELTKITYQSDGSSVIDWLHCFVNAPHLSHLELRGEESASYARLALLQKLLPLEISHLLIGRVRPQSASYARLALLQKLLPLKISHLLIGRVRPQDMEGYGQICKLEPPGIAALLSSISPITPGGVWPNPDLACIDMSSSSAQDTGACAQVILDFVRVLTGASGGKDNLSGGGLAALQCFKVPADDESKSQKALQPQVDAIIKLASET